MSGRVIYCIESPIGAVYIGQTRDFNKRVAQYRSLNCVNQIKIYRSLKKYGFENHKFEKIHHFFHNERQELLDTYEKSYIKLFRENGFSVLNISNGGGAPMDGRKHSEATKAKMKGRLLGKLNPNYGKGCFGVKNGRRRAINQYDTNGNFIKEWDTITNASKELNINRLSISNVVNDRAKSAGGFVFKYKL